jgi:predicted acyltransferase
MKSAGQSAPSGWKHQQLVALSVLMLVINVLVVIGLKARWVVPTMIATGVLCSIAHWLTADARSEAEKFIKHILRVGVFFLALGFVFEPFEGGIKKDHSTMSYYFVTGGLAIMMLIALTILIDVFQKRKWFNLLITSGQNPLVAYAGVNSLVPPVIGLLGVEAVINNFTPTPWLGALRGAFMTYLVALAASVCAKRNIFLKT